MQNQAIVRSPEASDNESPIGATATHSSSQDKIAHWAQRWAEIFGRDARPTDSTHRPTPLNHPPTQTPAGLA
jgi:hypothetical protein